MSISNLSDINNGFDLKCNSIQTKIPIPGAGGDVVGPASSADGATVSFNGTTGKNIENIDSTINITDEAQIALNGANERELLANTTYIIHGTVTFTYPIRYGVNCSLRGSDFSSTITFDETARDCRFLAEDQNLYLSNITVLGGGGRFTNTPGLGLFECTNYNIGAPAPFYGRNKRFKVTDCNIIQARSLGTIEGFGTLNITNNFFNGGGGSATPSIGFTLEGFAMSDGLSLEFNNNKMVLFAGAQQVSTAKLLNLKARVDPLLGFNAVTLTGNIFHPRNNENGVSFDPDSRTALGNISGNVFIRTGGLAPLINYANVATFDNYNPPEIESYIIEANTGVVNSNTVLKSATLASASISSATATQLEPADNQSIIAINLSSRFAVQLDLTGVTGVFAKGERITCVASGSSALIEHAEAVVAGAQTVYILDMDGEFDSTPTTFSSTSGNATGGTLRFRYRYGENEPRKLQLVASVSVNVGNNKQYFIAPGDGTLPDNTCEVGAVSDNTGAGATLTVVCQRKYEVGDILNFYFRTADASAGNLEKGIINVI
jgi:hypothetical protein